MTVQVRPFVKWAGGKTRLLGQLAPLLPDAVKSLRHVEPFAGGAALFFGASPAVACLSDVNPKLICTYRAVRDDVEGLLAHLKELSSQHCTAHFYEVRARFNRGDFLCDAELGAALVYLNKTCFNGLYRENRKGEFNVPIGRYVHPAIVDEQALRVASQRLQGIELGVGDFEAALERAGSGDFVYLDPPYQPSSPTSSFCAYVTGGFSWGDQQRLRRAFDMLTQRGAHVMLSNSDTPDIRRLYAGLSMTSVKAARSINSRGRSRGKVRELVVRNYG